MRIRSFIIAYVLVLAILLFADRRPGSNSSDRYSHVVDLTEAQTAGPSAVGSRTRIISPDALIPGTWSAGQIPAERLIAPLVVLDLRAAAATQISLDDISAWEARHGIIPQGAVVAIRQTDAHSSGLPTSFPITREAAIFLVEARDCIGFALQTPAALSSDHALARQLALRGTYVVERAAKFESLPFTGSLVIVAPGRDKKLAEAPVRVLAMVR
jgi:kynurenine formamidase